jgi:hypothetical protein
LHRTPLIVDVSSGSWDDYLASICSHARRNYREATRRNIDLLYQEVTYDREQTREFMEMWERQLIRGRPIRWSFPIEHVDDLHGQRVLRVFAAGNFALHFVEDHQGYVECHPPMWDKGKHADRFLGHFMWFHLIKFGFADSSMTYLDFGGGQNGTWPELIRKPGSTAAYKWQYIPKAVKERPEAQPNFVVVDRGGMKRLEEMPRREAAARGETIPSSPSASTATSS